MHTILKVCIFGYLNLKQIEIKKKCAILASTLINVFYYDYICFTLILITVDAFG